MMDSNGRCTLCGSKKVDWMAIKVEANVGGGVKIPGQYGLWKWRFVKDTQIAQKFKSNPQFKSNL